MNKFIPVIFLSALIFVGAGCGAKDSTSQTTTKPAVQDGTSVNGKDFIVDSNSFGDYVKSGKSLKCVLLKPAEYIASMTTYISRGKMRSDSTLAGPDGVPTKGPGGVPMIEHQIIDGTWIYSWNDANKDQATKSTMEELQNLGGATSTTVKTEDNTNKMNYSCSNWSADNSFFDLPSDVNFRSFKEVMCAPCEKISDAKFKEQCKKSIGC